MADTQFPTENWFVCWQCREYFKTSKCFEKHNLINHAEDPEACSRRQSFWYEYEVEQKYVPTELKCPIGSDDEESNTESVDNVLESDSGSSLPASDSHSNVSEESEDPPSDKCSGVATSASMDDKETKDGKHKILSVDWLVCRQCKEYFKTRRAYVNHHVKIHGRHPGSGRSELQEVPNGLDPRIKVEASEIPESDNHQVPNLPSDGNIENSCELDITPPSTENQKSKLPPSLPFPCTLCSRRFRLRIQLNNHVRTHLGDKPFGCSECGKTFVLLKELEVHQEKHLEELMQSVSVKSPRLRKNSADLASSESDGELRRVEKVEKDGNIENGRRRKDYVCDYCGATYPARLKQRYLNHMNKHTGERPHVCKICGKTFSIKSNLGRHYEIHAEERAIFDCKMCGKTFTQRHNMYRHLRNMHGDTSSS